MGHATGSTLKEKGFHSYYSPATFDDAGLAQSVFNCLSEIKWIKILSFISVEIVC